MIRLLLLLFTLTLSLPSLGEQAFQYSGFGTLGIVQVNSDHYGYKTDINNENGTFEDEYELDSTSIFGIQPEYRFNDQFDIVTQFTYRDQPKTSLDTLTSLAFLRYAPSVEWEFRIGRTALDVFHLSEYRNVGFAYPWAKVPSEVYGLISFRHLDGLDAMRSFQINSKTLRTKIFAGKSKANYSSYSSPSEVELEKLIGISFELESANWSVTANYTEVQIAEDIANTRLISETIAAINPIAWPGNLSYAKEASLENANVHYASLGGRYFYDDWTFMSEVSHINGDSIYVRSSNSGYVSAIYNQGAHSFFATYAVSDTQDYRFEEPIDPVLFAELISNIELSSKLLNANQYSTSLGWRWNVTDTVAIKAQWERAVIEEGGAALWLSKNYETQEEIVHSFFLNASFIF